MKHTLLLILLLLPALSQAQTASFTVSMDTVCQDSCVTLINTSTGTIDSIKWVTTIDTVANPHRDTTTLCLLAAGVDTVKLYVYDSGRVDSAIRGVTIKRAPHPGLWDPGCRCVHGTYLSYQWYYGIYPFGYAEPGATDNLFPPFGAVGDFYVEVDSGGCFGFGGGGAIESVNTINSLNLIVQIYPNPTNGDLTILSNNQQIKQVSITNLLGQTAYTYQYNTKEVQIDVADLPSGIYLIKVNGSEVRKFVKE